MKKIILLIMLIFIITLLNGKEFKIPYDMNLKGHDSDSVSTINKIDVDSIGYVIRDTVPAFRTEINHNKKNSSYPFQDNASFDGSAATIRNGIIDLILFNADSTKYYNVSRVDRKWVGNQWYVEINEANSKTSIGNNVAVFHHDYSGVGEPSGIDKVILDEFGDSGITGICWIKWDEITEEWHGYYNWNVCGLHYRVFSDKIADAAITTDKIADAAITTDKIADGIITKINDNQKHVRQVIYDRKTATETYDPFSTSDGTIQIQGYTDLGYHSCSANDQTNPSDPADYPAGFGTELIYTILDCSNDFDVYWGFRIKYKYSRNGTQYPFNNMYFTAGTNQHYFGSTYRKLVRKGGGDSEINLVNSFFPDVNIDSDYIIFEVKWISDSSYVLTTYTVDENDIETQYSTYTFIETNISTATGKRFKLMPYAANVYIKFIELFVDSENQLIHKIIKETMKDSIGDLQNGIDNIKKVIDISNRQALGSVRMDKGNSSNSLICMFDNDVYETKTIFPFNDFKYKGKVDLSKRYICWGFDDGRLTDFEWVAPLFSKYGFKATFNIINSRTPTDEFINNVKGLISQGHEIGDHTILHKTYMYNSPLFNGQPNSGGDGGQAGFPLNYDFTEDVGGGKNRFGYTLTDHVTGVASVLGLADSMWASLDSSNCQQIRNHYSIFANSDIITYLDTLSNEFCGTSGSSVGSWSAEDSMYTGGIFTGCKTSENHEIWERLCEIQKKYYRHHYGLNQPLTEWSMPGGNQHQLYFDRQDDAYNYYDRDTTKLWNDWAEFTSTRILDKDSTGVSRSWADVLRSYGYRHVHDSHYIGRSDGQTQKMMNKAHIFNANFSKADALNQITLLNRVNSNYSTPGHTYNADSLAKYNDIMKWLYEGDNEFRTLINKICNYTARGTIPYGATDTGDSFTWKLFYEMYIRFCYLTGIEMITKSEAYDICYNHSITEGNLFANPNFERLAYKIIMSNSCPDEPDAWSGGYIDTTEVAPDSFSAVLYCDESVIGFYDYGIPLGKLQFTFYSKKTSSNGSVRIYAMRNSEHYNATTSLDLLASATIDSTGWKKYTLTFTLPDADIINNGIQGYEGWDNKICGLYFRIGTSGIKFTMPYLKRLRTDEI